jgi:hypothetical protein
VIVSAIAIETKQHRAMIAKRPVPATKSLHRFKKFNFIQLHPTSSNISGAAVWYSNQ